MIISYLRRDINSKGSYQRSMGFCLVRAGILYKTNYQRKEPWWRSWNRYVWKIVRQWLALV